jgi:hypothetical protein
MTDVGSWAARTRRSGGNLPPNAVVRTLLMSLSTMIERSSASPVIHRAPPGSSRDSSRQLERLFTNAEKKELAGQVFRNVALDGADFSSANLRGARFEGASLVRCSFAGADLRGVVFSMCDLREVDLAGVNFGENRFDGTVVGGVEDLSPEVRAAILESGGTCVPTVSSQR